jgi:hypothetical protein
VAQVWALVPVAFFSEGNAAGASHRTEVRVLGSANAYGAPFAALWALFPCATIKRPIFYLHVTVPLPDLCVLCAGSSRELRGRPALAHFQQGVLTTEVSHEQVLMTLDKPSFSQYGDEINLPIDWHGSQHPSSIDLSQPVDGQPDREFYCRCNLDAAL